MTPDELLAPWKSRWFTKEWVDEATDRVQLVHRDVAMTVTRLMLATPREFGDIACVLYEKVGMLRYCSVLKVEIERSMMFLPPRVPLEVPLSDLSQLHIACNTTSIDEEGR